MRTLFSGTSGFGGFIVTLMTRCVCEISCHAAVGSLVRVWTSTFIFNGNKTPGQPIEKWGLGQWTRSNSNQGNFGIRSLTRFEITGMGRNSRPDAAAQNACEMVGGGGRYLYLLLLCAVGLVGIGGCQVRGECMQIYAAVSNIDDQCSSNGLNLIYNGLFDYFCIQIYRIFSMQQQRTF